MEDLDKLLISTMFEVRLHGLKISWVLHASCSSYTNSSIHSLFVDCV